MKKRYFAALLAALLLALGAPAALADEPEAPEEEVFIEAPGGEVFQEGAFSGPQTIPDGIMTVTAGWKEEATEKLLAGLKSRAEEIYLYSLNIPTNEFISTSSSSSFYSTLLNDHPELFYVKGSYTYSTMEGCIYRIKPHYVDSAVLDPTQSAKDFDAAVKRALAQVNGLNDPVQIALILHDYLVLNCEYNWKVAKDLDINNGTRDDTSTYDNGMPWTAYGALVMGTPVCQGYALAYKYLLKQKGIDSVIISSKKMNHAWNAVKIYGNWYQVDTTWDDPTINREGRVYHAYFLLSDDTFGTYRDTPRRSQHYGWEQIVTCSDKTYESGYVFVDNNHPLYYRNGNFYYVKPENAPSVNNPSNSYTCNSVYKTSSLNNEGQRIAAGLGLSGNTVVLWQGDRLYVMPGRFSNQANLNEKVILVCNLDDGTTAQAGHFVHTPASSPDNYAKEDKDNYPGLRYNAGTNEVEAVSCTRRKTVYRIPAVSLLNTWSDVTSPASGISVAPGLSTSSGTGAAAVLWGGSATSTTDQLWAAFYNSSTGKLVSLQKVSIPERAAISNVRPVMTLAYLNAPSSSSTAKLILLKDSTLIPACAAG